MSYTDETDPGWGGDPSRGASMGRPEFGDISEVPEKSASVTRVKLTDGYDPGGAYWGMPSPGNHLYCAEAEVDGEIVFVRFTRAETRGRAIAQLKIPKEKLKKP